MSHVGSQWTVRPGPPGEDDIKLGLVCLPFILTLLALVFVLMPWASVALVYGYGLAASTRGVLRWLNQPDTEAPREESL